MKRVRNRISYWSKAELEAYFARRKAEDLDDQFLKPAKERGDRAALANALRGGCPVTPAMREFIAAFLDGEVPRRKKARPPSAAVQTRNMNIGEFVYFARKQGMRDPVLQAQRIFGVKRKRTVQDAARNFEEKLRAEKKVPLRIKTRGRNK